MFFDQLDLPTSGYDFAVGSGMHGEQTTEILADVGANRFSTCDPDRIERVAGQMIEIDREWENPFGDGNAAEQIPEAPPVAQSPEVRR